MVSRGQAMIIDGLFFLMICGFAAASLLWASSAYGDKSYEAYKYIYMTDYASAAIVTLSNLDYEYVQGSQSIQRAWLDELGAYMLGEFNETGPRYTQMLDKWTALCEQAPAPLVMIVYSEARGIARGTREEPMYLSCGGMLDEENEFSLYQDGAVNVLKYPYYSSPLQSKSCGTLRCEMEIKIYY